VGNRTMVNSFFPRGGTGRQRIVSLLLLFVLTIGLWMVSSQLGVSVANDNDSAIGPGWESLSFRGESVKWNENAKGHLICFLGCECPVARFYAPRLESIAKEYRPLDIEVVGVMSLLQDSPQDVSRFASEHGLSFPVIHDVDQSLARKLSATRVPEVVLLDPRGAIVYRGRIDDQMAPGVKKSQSTSNDLIAALEALRTGEPIKTASTPPVGCLISFDQKKNPEADSRVPTLAKDVMPIFYKHCYECHRNGDIGPFDISKVNEVRGWADMILETIETKRMPPWHANRDHGSFKNQRQMMPDETQTIKDWVASGSPLGDLKDLAPPPYVRTGWQLPKKPDLVVEMRDKPFAVPASGVVEYQYFVVDPKLEEDRWVCAAQVMPGNASVVHHAIVFVRPPDGVPIKGVSWLTSFVPGQRAVQYPHGYARKLPAGSKLVFQMHYTPTGNDQTDLTKMGLVFLAPDQVTHEVSTIAGIDQSFEIPPHANNYQVKGRISLPRGDAKILIAAPHMHLRGKSFRLNGQFQDDREEILLDVPNYDFNWQHVYEFAEPLDASGLKSLTFQTSYDNSSSNPFNPNPADYVMWGDQTWEEMAVVFLDVATVLKKDDSTDGPAAKGAETIKETKPPLERSVRYAKEFLKRFDKNRDGQVMQSEATELIQRYSFHSIDTNNDRIVTEDELIAAAEARRVK
jgi:peroxiredoxin